jgi:hypothetical protein
LLLFCFFTGSVRASHLVGGEISYTSDTSAARNPLRYFFKLVTFNDANSAADNPSATLYLGDGITITSERTSKVFNGTCNNIYESTYYFEHTFPGPGEYTAAYMDLNRTKSTNLANADLLPFTIATTFQIDLFDTRVNKHRSLSAPILCAAINQPFRLGLAASNVNGDSLTYELITPLTSRSVGNSDITIIDVPQYQLPAQASINARTGELTWFNPSQLGSFTFAVRVNRYYEQQLIGTNVREFIIDVIQPDNITQSFTLENRQELTITDQNQITFTPGQPLVIKVKYQTSGTAKRLVAFSDLLALIPQYTLDTVSEAGTATAEFKVTPSEAWQRRQPYVLIFRGKTIQNDLIAQQDLTLTLVAKPGTISSNPDQPGEPANTGEQSFVIYPNPAKEKFWVRNVRQLPQTKIRLYNAQQQLVLEQHLTTKNTRIHLPAAAGLYFYQVVSKNQNLLKSGKVQLE